MRKGNQLRQNTLKQNANGSELQYRVNQFCLGGFITFTENFPIR